MSEYYDHQIAIYQKEEKNLTRKLIRLTAKLKAVQVYLLHCRECKLWEDHKNASVRNRSRSVGSQLGAY
jgi:hypothetical protein